MEAQRNEFFRNNIRSLTLYERAMKSLLLSYWRYDLIDDHQCADIITDIIKVYSDVMREIFEIPENIAVKTPNAICTLSSGDMLKMEIAIVKIEGIANHAKPSYSVSLIDEYGQTIQIVKQLNRNSVIQRGDSNGQIIQDIPLKKIEKLKEQSQTISVNYNPGDQGLGLQWNECVIKFYEINPEGYINWFDFGNGVRGLIRIRFSLIMSEENMAAEAYLYRNYIADMKYELEDDFLKKFNRENNTPFTREILVGKHQMSPEILQYYDVEIFKKLMNERTEFVAENIPKRIPIIREHFELRVHFNMIQKMLVYRVNCQNERLKNWHINVESERTRLNIMNTIEPKDMAALWPINESMKYSISQHLIYKESEGIRESSMHVLLAYDDFFQIPPEGTFCCCNEWCNWDAFFYFNPEIRFMLLQHCQLFLKNPKNIPDLYLLAVLNVMGANVHNDIRIPLMGLLMSSISFCNFIFIKQLTDKSFRESYIRSFPTQYFTIQNVVKCLNKFETMILIRSLDKSWLNSNAIDYMKSMGDVLLWYGKRFLKGNEKSLYKREQYDFICIMYLCYLRNSIIDLKDNINMTNIVSISKAYIFGHDFDYDHIIPKTAAEERVLNWIMENHKSDRNIFNRIYYLTPRLSMLYQIHRYISKVSKQLIPNTILQRKNFANTCVTMDGDLWKILKNDYEKKQIDLNDDFFLNFTPEDHEDLPVIEQLKGQLINRKHWYIGITRYLTPERPFNDQLRDHMFQMQWFSLKNYSVAYSIQSYFIRGIAISTHVSNYVLLGSLRMQFIYSNLWVEENIPKNYIENNMIDVVFNKIGYYVESIQENVTNFYKNLWTLSYIESAVNSDPKIIANLTPEFVINSIIDDYGGILEWCVLGANHVAFEGLSQILGELEFTLNDFIAYSKGHFFNCVQNYIAEITNDSYRNCNAIIDVFDTLALWWVQANCFIITSIAAHVNQNLLLYLSKDLTNAGYGFFLAKPGLIPIIKSYKTHFFNALDQIKEHFTQFDDVFERIEDVIRQTKINVKHMFRELLQYIMYSVSRDFETLQKFLESDDVSRKDDVKRIIRLQTAFNVYFIGQFVDDFRKDFYIYRRELIYRAIDSLRTKFGEIYIHSLTLTKDFLTLKREEIFCDSPLHNVHLENFLQNDIIHLLTPVANQ